MSSEQRPICELLEWDSAFFGVTVARVRGDTLREDSVRDIDAWCKAQGVCFLYFPARADDAETVRLAESNGYSLVDIRMDFDRRVDSACIDEVGGPPIRGAVDADMPILERIARESYNDTRFYYDGHLRRELCDALYERWIRESCRGFADAVLVAESDGRAAAFVTCHLKKDEDSGRIGLVGVDAKVRGQGLGRHVVQAGLKWFAAAGFGRVRVATQGRNVAAQRLYQRCGFMTSTVQLYYHKWYTRQGGR